MFIFLNYILEGDEEKCPMFFLCDLGFNLFILSVTVVHKSLLSLLLVVVVVAVVVVPSQYSNER